ncbi:UDP-galactopyranose mutase [Ensifer sp. ENS01]|uniref:UDP-galactopyranose mutase n=1 Tax=Ensifer sp. ENS01 TaxID=2769293 RepID=UPI0017856AFE|nr:UDP-galactopyranose mutase [Ensifer sp. ENS01]MBD9498990.1 UDP-galactopyranose mutase [Ensifer sp. ENS01]
MDVLTADLKKKESSSNARAPVICFSHLRWDYVVQRPQHLMKRFARDRHVYFFEEFIPTDHHLAYLEIHPFAGTTVKSVRPRIPREWTEAQRNTGLAGLLDELLDLVGHPKPVLWFYTPMMFPFARHVDAAAIVYDCMDELANFRFAPANMVKLERELMHRADVVFTGGHSLYDAKRLLHDNIHPFPSSVDVGHFRSARTVPISPPDQADLAGPVLGFCGVIDERLDLELISVLAARRPSWSIVLIGPVAKIREEDLPRAPNIQYLGQKDYKVLPAYFSGWNVALMPFAMNEATRFISPTKTPEYLAAGLAVVTTPVVDVVRQYKDISGVFFASDASEFVEACEAAMNLKPRSGKWLKGVDEFLSTVSWDETHRKMDGLVQEAAETNLRSISPISRKPAKMRSRRRSYDFLIVGAGFAGAVLAERLANKGKHNVLVCDRRSHIAGNAYDFYNEHGVLVHKYGPHIFHTNSEMIFDYLSRFTAWRPYEHRVLADVEGKLLPIPINRTTLNGLYGLDLKDDDAAAQYLASKAEPMDRVRTSKDVVIAQVGLDLYRTFFEGYTRKQWGLDPSQLDKAVTARIPTRTNTDDRYFPDTFQAMPKEGYTKMFENMLDSDRIDIRLNTDFRDVRDEFPGTHIIFTGPIDEFFNYQYGRLPYRCLRFEHTTYDQRRILPVGVVNFPSEEIPYTRVTEFKHITGQVHPKTSVCHEYACSAGDPYYPIPRPENQELYNQYALLARSRSDVTFVGRLASYRYYNMDQVVGQALSTFKRFAARGTADHSLGVR